MTTRAIALLLLTLSSPLAANTGPAPHFGRERPVTPARPGPNRLPVDVPLLTAARALRYDGGGRYAGGLDDLRLFSPDGKEVPFLVVAPAEPRVQWQDGRATPVLASDDESGFEVDLGSAALVDRLRLTGIPAPFLKRVRVEGSGDRSHWTLVVREATVFDLPDEGLQRTELAFAPETLRYLRVTWDDRTSARVPMPPAVAARLVDRTAPPPPLQVAISFERRPSEPGRSRFRLRLPGPGLPVRALELDTGEARLLRDVRVTEPRLAGDEVVPRDLGHGRLRRAARGALTAGDLRIAIAPPAEPEIELVVDDESNPPLDLRGVTAELAPLPWIYFESTGGETLMARFGDARLAAPRYDLEATRDALSGTTLAEAGWGDVIALAEPAVAPPEVTGQLPAVGAPIDASRFRFTRSIPPGPIGLTALVLDAAVLAHSRSLADLRIVDAAGRQIPYVVERVGEPLTLRLAEARPIPSRPEDDGALRRVSRYEIVLPYEALPPARLVVTTTARVFRRTVTILVGRPATDPRSTPRMEVVRSVAWGHADPDTSSPALVLELPTLRATSAVLTVDDGDNSALPLGGLELLLPTNRLRFFRADAGLLTLLYGAPATPAPRYDLALLTPRLLGASAHEVSLGAETGEPEPRPQPHGTATQHGVFWGALAAAVVGLVVVLARLLRTDADEGPGATSGHGPSNANVQP